MTRIIDPSGKVLIEELGFLPSPGTRLKPYADGTVYVVTSDPPEIRQVETYDGRKPYMQFVTAKLEGEAKPVAGKVQSSGRRGPAVEG